MEGFLSRIGIIKIFFICFLGGIIALLIVGTISYMGINTGLKGFEKVVAMVSLEATKKEEVPGLHLLTTLEKLKKELSGLAGLKEAKNFSEAVAQVEGELNALKKALPQKDEIVELEKLVQNLIQLKKQEFDLKKSWQNYTKKILLEYNKIRKA